MKVRHTQRGSGKVELQMTPMIDIVFMLLVFFIMTFKIVAPEGDFSVKMPLGRSEGQADESLPPITIRLRADANGNLAGIIVGQNAPIPRNDFNLLRAEIIKLVGHGTEASVAAETEVELNCDYQLRYEYVIDTMNAISGYVADDGKSIVKVIEKIRFTPPKQAPS